MQVKMSSTKCRPFFSTPQYVTHRKMGVKLPRVLKQNNIVDAIVCSTSQIASRKFPPWAVKQMLAYRLINRVCRHGGR